MPSSLLATPICHDVRGVLISGKERVHAVKGRIIREFYSLVFSLICEVVPSYE